MIRAQRSIVQISFDCVTRQGRCAVPRHCHRQKNRRASYLASLLLLTLVAHPLLAQEKPDEP